MSCLVNFFLSPKIELIKYEVNRNEYCLWFDEFNFFKSDQFGSIFVLRRIFLGNKIWFILCKKFMIVRFDSLERIKPLMRTSFNKR